MKEFEEGMLAGIKIGYDAAKSGLSLDSVLLIARALFGIIKLLVK